MLPAVVCSSRTHRAVIISVWHTQVAHRQRIAAGAAADDDGDRWPWELADLVGEWPAPARAAAGGVVALSVLSVNLVVNILSPANDLMNLAPDRLAFKPCALASLGLAAACCPWCAPRHFKLDRRQTREKDPRSHMSIYVHAEFRSPVLLLTF